MSSAALPELCSMRETAIQAAREGNKHITAATRQQGKQRGASAATAPPAVTRSSSAMATVLPVCLLCSSCKAISPSFRCLSEPQHWPEGEEKGKKNDKEEEGEEMEIAGRI